MKSRSSFGVIRAKSSSSCHRNCKTLLKSVAMSVGVFLLAVPVTRPAQHGAFQWPDSSHYWRILVNVNQYIESRPPAWFAQDKVVTDLNVINVSPASHEAAEHYAKVRKLLESRHIAVGTYISGTTVEPEAVQTTYPLVAVPIEQMPANAKYVGSWPGHAERRIIDVTDPDTRHAFQAGLTQLWQQSPAPIRFVDNAAIHPAVERKQPWQAYCDNIEEIRKIAESQNSRAIFNIAMHVGLMSDDETQRLIRAVGPDNGIALEMPWHASIQKSPEATAKAVARYRQLLDSGLVVIMLPVNIDANVLSDWIRTWRKPGDHLYISAIFWKPPDLSAYSGQ
jgi:hypothetical protein